ncbi:DUF2252 domain-containing protein [Dermatobacter hominis]|uniref:DUF2252 domain-containing protein n=1 Tax=Dermatobacter hominis TaxID=2884263 RepID=UPI001D11A973|nr:DUF2252 domain-containing protein [Dermatobacter hominis]UDY35353.1 DUF2252 domain-containing protein [Dermatobacter hominis]
MTAVTAPPTAVPSKDHLEPDEHQGWGRSRRDECPRTAHGTWELTDRRDPVAILQRQEEHRLQFLLPIRHARMLASPFAFYRGSAAVMSADLATTPTTGMPVQLCGDAHLSNFGLFGSPERALVFDCNDFDETHPGPWEWDVKRLAVSAVLMAGDRGWDEEVQRRMARNVAFAYRAAMSDFATKGRLAVWYSRLTDDQILAVAQDENRTAVERQFRKARLNDVTKAIAKYTEVVDGHRRFVHQPPLVMRLDDSMDADAAAAMHQTVIGLFAEYLDSIPAYLRVLLGGYELIDVALKVVGVGSVGTRCYIALVRGRDDADLMILQIKEAEHSVLEPFVDPVAYDNQGHRVVVGQQLMQAASDQFLGWANVGHHDFYIRQFRDMKGSINLEKIGSQMAENYLLLCAWTLARAHSRSGSRIAISSYLGKSDKFDRSISDFSMAYAGQVHQDHAAFAAAAADGRIEVATSGY